MASEGEQGIRLEGMAGGESAVSGESQASAVNKPRTLIVPEYDMIGHRLLFPNGYFKLIRVVVVGQPLQQGEKTMAVDKQVFLASPWPSWPPCLDSQARKPTYVLRYAHAEVKSGWARRNQTKLTGAYVC